MTQPWNRLSILILPCRCLLDPIACASVPPGRQPSGTRPGVVRGAGTGGCVSRVCSGVRCQTARTKHQLLKSQCNSKNSRPPSRSTPNAQRPNLRYAGWPAGLRLGFAGQQGLPHPGLLKPSIHKLHSFQRFHCVSTHGSMEHPDAIIHGPTHQRKPASRLARFSGPSDLLRAGLVAGRPEPTKLLALCHGGLPTLLWI